MKLIENLKKKKFNKKMQFEEYKLAVVGGKSKDIK
jgi:hypothetical protein